MEMLDEKGLMPVQTGPVTCNRCGKIFDGPIIAADTKRVLVPGHVQGDPRSCHPAGTLTGSDRDVRVRRHR